MATHRTPENRTEENHPEETTSQRVGVEGPHGGGPLDTWEAAPQGAASPEARAEGAGPASARRGTAALRRRLAAQLFFELALPLGSYYGLRAAGLGQWLSMVVGSVLLLPWIGYGIVRQRRVEAAAVFTLSLVVGGTLLSLVTGSPRVLLVRDSWITAAIGLWVLGTLLTRRPFMMTAARGIVIAKVGEPGLVAWEAQWDADPVFRHHLRLITAVWGCVFLLDAVARVVLAYTIPVDAFPLTSTVLWLVLLGGLIGWHNWYVSRNGLKL